ncbi:MAG TPA: hypothetical protein VH307_27170, partial [Streptosporangiaceae bacterium]|nr:hypothetical protein [Streptosporangiaceae bacterium]
GTVLTYLEFHPLALLWLSIAFLVIAGGLWTRRRRLPPHPYPESTRWTGTAHAPVPVVAYAGAQPGPSPSHDRWAWIDGEGPDRSEIFELGLLDGPLHVDRRLARLRLEDTRPHGGHPGGHRPASPPGHGRATDSDAPLPRLDY